MKGPFVVSECGGVSVRLVPLPSRPGFYAVYPPIWHPAVSWPSSIIDEESIFHLENIAEAIKNPWNIDASIEFLHRPEIFQEKNRQIQQLCVSKDLECCVCFEEGMFPLAFTCYSMHWVCLTCSLTLDGCPICRFIPLEKRGKLLGKF